MRSHILQAVMKFHQSVMLRASSLAATQTPSVAMIASTTGCPGHYSPSSWISSRQASTWSASLPSQGILTWSSMPLTAAAQPWPLTPLDLARNLPREPEPFEAEFDEDEHEYGEFEDFEEWEDISIDDLDIGEDEEELGEEPEEGK